MTRVAKSSSSNHDEHMDPGVVGIMPINKCISMGSRGSGAKTMHHNHHHDLYRHPKAATQRTGESFSTHLSAFNTEGLKGLSFE